MSRPLPVRYEEDCAVVELPDEIDLANADLVHRQVLNLITAETTELIIDMSGTSFCAARGFRALEDIQVEARRRGACICIVARAWLLRACRLSQVDQLIPIYPSVELARHEHRYAALSTG
jgi:anti-anti-sigma factor